MEQRLVYINKVKEVTLEDSVSFISYTPDNGVDCYINADTVFTLPENPTNGDMIKALFPNAEIFRREEYGYQYVFVTIQDMGNSWKIRGEWWDAPYRKEE